MPRTLMEVTVLTVSCHKWEETLLMLTDEAEQSGGNAGQLRIQGNSATLQRAYAECDAITQRGSRTFFTASGLLPAAKRRAIRALYAFCRRSDDIIDSAQRSADAEESLGAWRRLILSYAPPPQELIATAWADTRARFNIPQRYAEQLIDGVGRDLRQNRYNTFSELTTYAYGVASTVGLMSMHIIRCSDEEMVPEAIPYAVRLGVALQLTNILRDVGEDWLANRLYLPLEELAAFGLTEEDVGAGRIDNRWRAFMRYQIARTRRLYAEAWPGIMLLRPDGRFAIAAAADLYRAILEDIEKRDYDVFRHHAHVSAWGKLRRLPIIRWRISPIGRLRQG